MDPNVTGEDVGSADEGVRAHEEAHPSADGGGAPDAPLARLVTVRPEPRNAWLWIWIRPRGVIRAKIDRGPTGWMWLIAVLAGFGAAIDKAADRSMGDEYSLPMVLVMCAGSGIVLGIPALAVVAWALAALGRAFGGRATNGEMRIALCWSAMPGVVGFVLGLVLLAMYGKHLFTSDMLPDDFPDWKVYVTLALALPGVVLTFWSVFISLKALSEAHKVSVWRGLFIYIVAGAILLVLALILYSAGRSTGSASAT